MNTTPPDECRAWAQLSHHAESWRAVHLRELFANDAARAGQFGAEAAGLRFDYSRQRLGAMTLRLLAHLAGERGFAEWRSALLSGKEVNDTEKRAAWHTALRAGPLAPVEVQEALSRMRSVAETIRSEGRFKRVVNLGTGGSDLGPRLVADALADGRLDVRFAANVDPKDLGRALEGAEPASTLFVVVSKTFTTQETMANAAAAKAWGGRHFIAVSSNVEEARKFGAMEVLPMWDSNALRLLPAYLQQLEMESNGKRVGRDGRELGYATAPVLWGAEGTVSQHSFHQLLHQGTQVVPADFIDVASDKVLSANLLAQADALAFGTDQPGLPAHRQYPGNRPSSILSLEKVTPGNLGRLIALYEHKVFTQGVLWNINSFDQWGVELGKEMAKKILKGER
jgi:glucose-6-phosphate isomerase